MGVGSFTSDDDDSTGGKQKTYITWKNPNHPDNDLDEDDPRHSAEFFKAVNTLRDQLGQDINALFGEFAAAAVEADEGDEERLQELFARITE